MSERLNEEKNEQLESLEDQKYAALFAAINEEDSIMKDIEVLLEAATNREEAEKVILEKHAPLMDKAIEKSRQAFDEWEEAMKKDK